MKDYLTAVYEWIDEVIAKNTTSSMTSMQKIDAVSSYLRETFRYAHVYKGKYVHLAKEPGEPFFLTHRWDSLESPAVLRMIAEKIGGFSAGIVFILLMMYGLSEIPWGDMELPVETSGKRGGIVEAAGEGDLCDGVAGGAEHFHSHTESVIEKVLLG